MGARGIEFDIRICADSKFVIFHDAAVDHKTDGSGKVQNMTLAELKALNLLYDGRPTEHKIPTLKEALENVQGRFMVDLDFKAGPADSAQILKKVLHETGFNRDDAPLVTIFCRDPEAYEKLKPLNELYSVRPLYLNKDQAKQMSEEKIRVLGLRSYQFTSKRADRIDELNMHLFSNAMKYNISGLIRAGLGIRVKRKKPRPKTLRKIYKRAMDGRSLFIQTDYLPDLVKFLKEHNLYQDQVLDRNFQPISPKVAPAILGPEVV